MKFFSKRGQKQTGNLFPGFQYKSEQIIRFLQSGYTFTILLDNGKIIHHQPKDVNAFGAWLMAHHVPNILHSA
ncbi:hypothetical protein [Dyadobacter sp. MSC1_007]|jgi:hypothetical protein|uniref:hypothetical protein n=1 Tax=Dyadobacter sp. MSC1_007 TaxID=2909264 RepID=UPI00202EA2E8|nr:hypothetical protein [Dyadobacter sp. MSC1_007]